MVTKRVIGLARKNAGQELLEFAITLPIFLLIVFGIFDLGRVVYYASALQNAAREGARYGVVNPYDDTQITGRVKDRSLGLDPDDITIGVNWSCKSVKVDVDFYFRPVTPFIGAFLPGGDVNVTLGSELQRERWLADFGQPDYGCNPAA